MVFLLAISDSSVN